MSLWRHVLDEFLRDETWSLHLPISKVFLVCCNHVSDRGDGGVLRIQCQSQVLPREVSVDQVLHVMLATPLDCYIQRKVLCHQDPDASEESPRTEMRPSVAPDVKGRRT